MNRRNWLSLWALVGLLSLVVIAVLIAPSKEAGRPYSSHSAGLNGVRLARDLAGRLGWKPESRIVAFSDTIRDPAPVQVVVNAKVSAVETHALLDFVRGGGSLLVAGPSDEMSDSLFLVAQETGAIAENPPSEGCENRNVWESALAQFGDAAVIGFRRPMPDDTVGFGLISVQRSRNAPAHSSRAAVGLPFGAGRLVMVADENYLVNDALRRCELAIDVTYVRMLEYLTRGQRGQRVAFDEFHHGYGVRGGSFAAIWMYLSQTPSGHMLGQLAVAGLLLLFAFAPRPLAPRDPETVARRSPLEHADALARAYASVNATRTATARLLAGLRRRVRRDRHRSRDSDEQFLAAAAALSPEAAKAAGVVASALDAPLSARDLTSVASALETIERAFERPISPNR